MWRLAGLAVALVALAAAPTAASTSTAGESTRIVLISDGAGCRDHFVGILCRAFQRTVAETGITGRILTPSPREDFAETLAVAARQSYDLVVVAGGLYADDLARAAKRFPATRFAILDVPLEELGGRPRNVQALVVETNQAAFLAGVLAARMEQRRPGRDVVGAVGGFRYPPVDDFLLGFSAGARHAAPGIKLLTAYSNDFLNKPRCRALALRQIARGAGVIFNVAGGCGVGALEAAGQRNVWGIGVDTDQSFLGRHVLTSVVKDFEPMLRRLAEAAKHGRFAGGSTSVLGLAEGAAGLAKLSPAVPPAVRAELERLHRQLVAGRIQVPGALREATRTDPS
jgi:basic membrane protein A and related proteins